MVTLFVDEGKRRGYVLVAVTVADGNVVHLRKSVVALRTPRSERIHFVRESDGRRRTLLKEFARLGVQATVFYASGLDDRRARSWCLEQLVELAAATGVGRLIIETDDSIVQTDNRTLYRAIKERDIRESLRYEHRHAVSEPLLSLPDAVAWSFGRGGSWGVLVEPLIKQVVRLAE